MSDNSNFTGSAGFQQELSDWSFANFLNSGSGNQHQTSVSSMIPPSAPGANLFLTQDLGFSVKDLLDANFASSFDFNSLNTGANFPAPTRTRSDDGKEQSVNRAGPSTRNNPDSSKAAHSLSPLSSTDGIQEPRSTSESSDRFRPPKGPRKQHRTGFRQVAGANGVVKKGRPSKTAYKSAGIEIDMYNLKGVILTGPVHSLDEVAASANVRPAKKLRKKNENVVKTRSIAVQTDPEPPTSTHKLDPSPLPDIVPEVSVASTSTSAWWPGQPQLDLSSSAQFLLPPVYPNFDVPFPAIQPDIGNNMDQAIYATQRDLLDPATFAPLCDLLDPASLTAQSDLDPAAYALQYNPLDPLEQPTLQAMNYGGTSIPYYPELDTAKGGGFHPIQDANNLTFYPTEALGNIVENTMPLQFDYSFYPLAPLADRFPQIDATENPLQLPNMC